MLRVNIQIIDDIFIVGNYQVKYVSKVMCGFIYCLGEIKLKQQVTEFVGSRGRLVGTRRLCWHNFEHNRYLKALSIMPA